MSTTNATIALQMLANEVFDTTEVPAGASEAARTMKINQMSLSLSLNSSSTPAVDKPPIYRKLSTTTTLDLTAVQAASIPSTATRSVDMTGKKVVGVALKAGASNAAAVNVAPGGTNPYPLFGSGNDIDIGPGETLIKAFSAATNLPAVSSTVKDVTITISGSDTLEILLLLGT